MSVTHNLREKKPLNLYQATLATPLGAMIALSDSTALYLLEFTDRKGLEQELARLKKRTKATIVPGRTAPIDSIERELQEYFAGTRTEFSTPICVMGSDFQQRVWQELQRIPLGHTRSYAQVAQALGMPSAYRAVARANSTNQLPLIIPCHRVIAATGQLSGYAGGVARKQWLINHETRNAL